MVIDTESSHNVISPDILVEIDVTHESDGTIYEAYGIGGSVPFIQKSWMKYKSTRLLLNTSK